MRCNATTRPFGIALNEDGDETNEAAAIIDDHQGQPEDSYANDELHSLLLNVIRELPEPSRTMFMRHYFEGISIRDIAQEIGMPENAVKTYIYRGRKQLAEKVSQYADKDGLK